LAAWSPGRRARACAAHGGAERLGRGLRARGVLDILEGGQHRNEAEALENETDVLAAEVGQLVVRQLADVAAGNEEVAGVATVEAAYQVQQRRLAAARWAVDDRETAPLHEQVHTLEHGHLDVVHAVGLDDAAQLGDGFVH
jgi:hypothetical protein